MHHPRSNHRSPDVCEQRNEERRGYKWSPSQGKALCVAAGILREIQDLEVGDEGQDDANSAGNGRNDVQDKRCLVHAFALAPSGWATADKHTGCDDSKYATDTSEPTVSGKTEASKDAANECTNGGTLGPVDLLRDGVAAAHDELQCMQMPGVQSKRGRFAQSASSATDREILLGER